MMRIKKFLLGMLLFCCLASSWAVIVFAHDWMAPGQEAERVNPIPMDGGSIARGKTVYQQYCASCHGETGQGLGASETGLSRDTPNLNERLMSHTDGDFFWKIRTGRAEMPSFRQDLSENQVWEVIHFIRSRAEK